MPGSRLGDGDRPHGWTDEMPDLDDFRRQQLDLYIPAGDTGFGQGALRDRNEPGYAEVREAVQADRGLWIDVLYGDFEGGQRTIGRFLVSAWPEVDARRSTVLRYWNLDREDPR